MCFAPEATGCPHVLCGCDDGSLRCWDWSTGAAVRTHRKKAPEVTALAVLFKGCVLRKGVRGMGRGRGGGGRRKPQEAVRVLRRLTLVGGMAHG